MNNEDIMTVIENRDQAVALADFLWCEKQRHLDDIDQIDRDLKALEEKWAVTPRMKGRM